jgi:outer membrane lipoprotein-sorting protein
MPRSLLAGIVFLGNFSIQYAYTQATERLPSPEAVLDRFIEVSGGQANYDRIQNSVRKMTVQASGKTAVERVTYRTRSGNMRQIAHTGDGQTEIGVNDGVTWTRTAESAQILEAGEERVQVLQSAEFLSDSRWRQVYKSAETIGTETVEGKLCYVLRVVPFVGAPQKRWYDQKTGLQARQLLPVPAGGEAEYTVEEYFEVEGIKMPRLFQARMNGDQFTITVDDVKFNQQIPDSILALPPDIERLMRKRAALKQMILTVVPSPTDSSVETSYKVR